MSEAVERRLLELLENPTHSPFGMPIPGLELLGLPAAETSPCKAVSEVEPGDYRLARIGEPVQVDPAFLTQLGELQLIPGVFVSVSNQGGGWLVRNRESDQGILLDELFAQHLFVCEIETT